MSLTMQLLVFGAGIPFLAGFIVLAYVCVFEGKEDDEDEGYKW